MVLKLSQEVFGMANYVTNYVFCNEDLYNDFLNVEYNRRIFQEGMYGPVGCILDEERRLVIFDTRGMDYKREQIEKIINHYHDVVWNCVEENLIEEGQFYWDGKEVTLAMRALQESVDECFFTIHFFDSDYKSFKKIMGFPDRIIEENYVTNTKREFCLSEYASNQIITYIDNLRVRLLRENHIGELPTVIDGNILDEYWFWSPDNNDRNHASICKCDIDLADQVEFDKGEHVKNEVKEKFTSFFKKNGIDIQLTYKEIKEFVMDKR